MIRVDALFSRQADGYIFDGESLQSLLALAILYPSRERIDTARDDLALAHCLCLVLAYFNSLMSRS